MPVKKKSTVKSDAVKSKVGGKVKSTTTDKLATSNKVDASSGSKTSHAKIGSRKVAGAAQLSVVAARKGSSMEHAPTKTAAVIPAQKHVTNTKISQQRNPMASSSSSKLATAAKSVPVKPLAGATAAKTGGGGKSAVTDKPHDGPLAAAGNKPAVAKSAMADSAARATGKVAEHKVAEHKSAAAPALDAAKFHAQRQAAQKPAPTRAMPAAVANAATQRISVPAAPTPAATTGVATPKDLAQKAQQAQQSISAKKPINVRHGFKTNEWIVYPAHGVGRIVAIEEQEIAGMALELFVITFEKDKMTLRVPTGKSASVGMRKLAEEGVVKRAMDTLKGKARIKRTMWSRRAQEFEQKINSGDLVSIAEVVRDLFRAETQPEQSYSERQLYEAALDRMAREIAAVEKIDERGAVQRVTEVLSKSAKSRRAESAESGGNGDVKAA